MSVWDGWANLFILGVNWTTVFNQFLCNVNIIMHGSKVKTCQTFLWVHTEHRCSGRKILINTQLLTESKQLTLVFAFEFTSGRLSKCFTVSVLWYMHATRSGEYSLDPWRRYRSELSVLCLLCRTASVCQIRRKKVWEVGRKGEGRWEGMVRRIG